MDDNLIKSRIDCNKKILNIIGDFINEYPEIRFMQALSILNILVLKAILTKDGPTLAISDGFYEESSTTLKRILGE